MQKGAIWRRNWWKSFVKLLMSTRVSTCSVLKICVLLNLRMCEWIGERASNWHFSIMIRLPLTLQCRIFMGKNTIAQIALGRTPEEEYKDNLRHVSKVDFWTVLFACSTVINKWTGYWRQCWFAVHKQGQERSEKVCCGLGPTTRLTDFCADISRNSPVLSSRKREQFHRKPWF